MTGQARAAIGAFLYGNLVIGTGAMMLPGMLEDLSRGLSIPLAQAGQLITLGAVVLTLAAPLVAATTSTIDRRRLLLFALGLYAVGHAACALAPGYAWLAVLRMVTVLGGAIFTPQAAATIGLMVGPERRAAAVTMIFAGWSIASVLAMPMGKLVAAYLGWRWAFGLVALMAAIGFVAIWRTTPSGLTVPALSLAAWRSVIDNRPLTLVLAVTLLSAAGQFVLLSYVAPSLTALTGAAPPLVAALFVLFGVFGVAGNLLAVRGVGRVGPDRAVSLALAIMLGGLVVWALATVVGAAALVWPLLTLAVVLWGLGCFSSNSAQQARLVGIAPQLASASIALNTSCIYAGQAIGAGAGGVLLAVAGLEVLPFAAVAAMAWSVWVSLRAARLARQQAS